MSVSSGRRLAAPTLTVTAIDPAAVATGVSATAARTRSAAVRGSRPALGISSANSSPP